MLAWFSMTDLSLVFTDSRERPEGRAAINRSNTYTWTSDGAVFCILVGEGELACSAWRCYIHSVWGGHICVVTKRADLFRTRYIGDKCHSNSECPRFWHPALELSKDILDTRIDKWRQTRTRPRPRTCPPWCNDCVRSLGRHYRHFYRSPSGQCGGPEDRWVRRRRWNSRIWWRARCMSRSRRILNLQE